MLSFSDQRSSARHLYIAWCLVCWTIHHTSAHVCVVDRPSRAHPCEDRPSRPRQRVCADRFDMRCAKKKWADVSSALVTTACKYAHAPRVHWVSGGTSPVSFCFLFVSVRLFEYICALSVPPRDIIRAWRRMDAVRERWRGNEIVLP